MEPPDHPLAKAILRAKVLAHGEVHRGRIRALTPVGQLILDVRAAVEADAAVRVWIGPAGDARAIDGVVTRREGHRVEARLDMTAEARDAVARLLAAAAAQAPLPEARVQFAPRVPDARDRRVPAPPPLAAPTGAPTAAPSRPAVGASSRPVVGGPAGSSSAAPGPDPRESDDPVRALARQWDQTRRALDDAEAQATFIAACARAGRIDVAIRAYRHLAASAPEDERVQRYLGQAATIASFSAMPASGRDAPAVPRRVRWLLTAFLIASAILTLAALVVASL